MDYRNFALKVGLQWIIVCFPGSQFLETEWARYIVQIIILARIVEETGFGHLNLIFQRISKEGGRWGAMAGGGGGGEFSESSNDSQGKIYEIFEKKRNSKRIAAEFSQVSFQTASLPPKRIHTIPRSPPIPASPLPPTFSSTHYPHNSLFHFSVRQ